MIYRNQTPTMTQIQMLAQMRITTVPEAVAFLRAMRPINDQIAGVLQRASLAQQVEINRASFAKEPVEEPVKNEVVKDPEPQKVFVPEDLLTEEGYSEEEEKAKVDKLKAAKSKTQKRKEEIVK